ncbi:hypothetical protein D3C84_695740 [compost metagenome]
MPLLEHLERLQQQRTPQPPTLKPRVHHQVLDIGTGPALANADHFLGIQGNEAQGRVIFRIGFELPLPHVQRGYATTAVEITELHQPVHGGAQFGAVFAQLQAGWPIRGRHDDREVTPHQPAEFFGQHSITLFGDSLGRGDQTLGQFRRREFGQHRVRPRQSCFLGVHRTVQRRVQ